MEAQGVTSFVFHSEMLIERGYCDPAGIVLVNRFFEFFDANTWMLFEAAIGVKRQDIRATYNIMGIPLVDVRANFLLPVKSGDIIGIASRISEFRRSSFDVEHHITINGELAVDGGETRVWTVRNKNNSGKIGAVAIPSDIIARFN